jgi:hypothetical protein
MKGSASDPPRPAATTTQRHEAKERRRFGGNIPTPLPLWLGPAGDECQAGVNSTRQRSTRCHSQAVPARPLRREIGRPGLSRQFFGGYSGIIGGFPPRSESRTNPRPRVVMCLTNKGWPGGLRSRISPRSPKSLISDLLWRPLAVAGDPPHDGSHPPRPGSRPGRGLPSGSRHAGRKLAPALVPAMAESRAERQIRGRGWPSERLSRAYARDPAGAGARRR